MNSTPSLPDSSAAEPPIRLPANANTVAAEDLQVRLVLAADRLAPIRIDAAEVESVGQAVLQLIAAARIEAAAQELGFEIVAASDAFVARVAACRLAGPLGLALPEEMTQ